MNDAIPAPSSSASSLKGSCKAKVGRKNSVGLLASTHAPASASGGTAGPLNVKYKGGCSSFLEKLIARPKSGGEIK